MELKFKIKEIKKGTIITSDEIFQQNQNKHLIVVLHGILNAWEKIDPLVIAIDDIYQGNATIWVPLLPYRRFLNWEKPEKVVDKLEKDLDSIWNQGKYTSLRIFGHSLGGVYARALLLHGLKNLKNKEEDHWSKCKDIRLVLLAAVNRGAGISRHMKPQTVVKTVLGIFLGRLMQVISVGYLEPILFSGMRGSKFITKMRLEWREQDRDPIHPIPLTVQLLGSIDDIVIPEDNIDLVTGKNFRYLDVPYTGHVNILNMNDKESKNNKEKSEIQDRKKILETALTKTATDTDIWEEEVRPWELKEIDEAEQERRNRIKHVIFVIHGIRDEGHWTDKIARRVWDRAKKNEKDSLAKVVDSYGYFGMGPFLVPGVRWQKVTWLMEQYLEARAKYPEAKFGVEPRYV